jgi:hypothetical protein
LSCICQAEKPALQLAPHASCGQASRSIPESAPSSCDQKKRAEADKRAGWGDEKDGSMSRMENEQAWRVSNETIKAGTFNLDLKRPQNSDSDSGFGDVDPHLPESEKLLAQIHPAHPSDAGLLRRSLKLRLDRRTIPHID